METVHSVDHGDHHAMADGDHQHSLARISNNENKDDDDDVLPSSTRYNVRRQSCPESGSIRTEKPQTWQTQQRFETVMMTGDFFIKFNGKTSHHSPVLLKNNRVHNISFGHCSTPASPEESEHRSRVRAVRETSPFNSPISDKKGHFSYSGVYVRTSKSEDHLQKASLTAVSIDIEDEMASSLNTLLDTKQDNPVFDRVTWTCGSSIRNSEDSEDCKPLSPSPPPESLSSSSGEIISPSKPESSKSSSSRSNQERSEHYSKTSVSGSITSESTTIRKDLEREDSSEGECTSDLVSTISSCEEIEQLPDSDSDQESIKNGHVSESCENKTNLNNYKINDQFSVKCETVPSIKKSVSEGINIIVSDEYGVTQTHVENNRRHSEIPNGGLTLCIENFQWPDHLDCSLGSPTSFGSESTLDEVPYEELMESHDEESFAAEDETTKSISPTTTDDESDIESLHSFHYSPKAVDMPSAYRLAKRLYNLEGFKKSDVSRHLSKNNEFSRVVAEEYLKYFDFVSDSLDTALRKFLKKFCLIGETQERERVLLHFSKRYLDCNPGIYRSQDAAHTLTCALMLLNSDLHGENVVHKMTCGEFIENLSELNDGENFPRDILKSLYYSIKTQPLQWATYVPNPNSATEYKKGYVMRKCCIDPNGKKTPLGKRGWKMVYATLRDLVLYLHKDDHGFKKNQLYDSLHNSIRIHHSLATKATDYKKKQHVFRFQTADLAEYLFQTSDSKELQSWVDTLNLVAASLSAPPLASAVGSQKKFQRPLLPVSHTKLNL
ncbi:uncharacterized protein LOC111630187, partial [Centruroides sculpturatus]|uniref:uncharacterized protein LOC111630187 n=1 Tax=Centruroides sculpturatus TaxID=218467 RepID=UPI000C6E7D28